MQNYSYLSTQCPPNSPQPPLPPHPPHSLILLFLILPPLPHPHPLLVLFLLDILLLHLSAIHVVHIFCASKDRCYGREPVLCTTVI